MAYYLRTAANDWDLEAIIRGWGGGDDGGGGSSSSYAPPPPPPLLGLEFEAEMERGGVNELEELWKPFVGQVEQAKYESPRSCQTETASPCSSSFVVFDHDEDVGMPEEEVKGLVDRSEAQAKPSCKRRKSKHKVVRVVHKGVGEDGVLLDKWNWRKYGQKAIKGSPHPRSYYRCSSSGGCQARKHVEQSKEDHETCIVTYIGEHSHSPPTRRHAQAGRKITKFSTSATRVITKNANKTTTTTNTPPCSTGAMAWAVSEPLVVGGGSLGGFVEEDLLSNSTVSLDHDDWSVWWELDPFFSTSIC